MSREDVCTSLFYEATNRLLKVKLGHLLDYFVAVSAVIVVIFI